MALLQQAQAVQTVFHHQLSPFKSRQTSSIGLEGSEIDLS